MQDAIKRTAYAAEENIKLEPCIEFNQPIVTQNSPFRIPKCKRFRRVARKMRWKREKRRTLWSGVKIRFIKEKSKLRPGLQKLEWKRVKKRLHKEWKTRRTSLVQWVDRFFGSEDQLDLLTLARVEAAKNVYETYLENRQRFVLHRRSHSFTAGDLSYTTGQKKKKKKNLQTFSHFQRTIGCPSAVVTGSSLRHSRTNIKVVHVQHCPLLKRNQPSKKTVQTKRLRGTAVIKSLFLLR
ncbi:hypothetical protein NPIL_146831 [Nephila pilipes]|uniref:Uncharacterized protein n=1 Tax=Nephila pilipes TaxID=299642 RepID=A0A8X6Q8U6_NEPPI|nr:hypothetical protein NPIL_146831 [Nephila pilipes]